MTPDWQEKRAAQQAEFKLKEQKNKTKLYRYLIFNYGNHIQRTKNTNKIQHGPHCPAKGGSITSAEKKHQQSAGKFEDVT